MFFVLMGLAATLAWIGHVGELDRKLAAKLTKVDAETREVETRLRQLGEEVL